MGGGVGSMVRRMYVGDGVITNLLVGLQVGDMDGNAVGPIEGAPVGGYEGVVEGADDGMDEGRWVGANVGTLTTATSIPSRAVNGVEHLTQFTARGAFASSICSTGWLVARASASVFV